MQRLSNVFNALWDCIQRMEMQHPVKPVNLVNLRWKDLLTVTIAHQEPFLPMDLPVSRVPQGNFLRMQALQVVPHVGLEHSPQ